METKENYTLRILEVRELINMIDDQIVELLDKRFYLSKEIGNTKKKLHLEAEDLAREEQIINRLSEKNLEHIDKDFVKAIYKVIFTLSKFKQKEA